MLQFLKKLLGKKTQQDKGGSIPKPEHPFYPVPLELGQKTEMLGQLIGHSDDTIFRRLRLGQTNITVIAVYVDGLVNLGEQNESIFKPLMLFDNENKKKTAAPKQNYELIKNNLISVGEITEHTEMWEAALRVLSGDTVILLEGIEKVLTVKTRDLPQRALEDPKRETAVRGPQVGFTELMRTNMALVRHRLKHPSLRFEVLRGGFYTNTDVAIGYLQGVVNPKIVQEVRQRLQSIMRTDGILESGNIEGLIEDSPHSPFPQIEHTERPDKAVAHLLEGKVIIITDNSPFVLTVPTLFLQFIQASDDYYERYFFGSFIRLVRIPALLIALFLPSVYVALITYHQEMIPFTLILALDVAREGVPFPALVEALLMETVFEFLREAGIRLPMQIGQAVSIVGAIILGQAAIQANLVSPAMVIVVALTGISSFLLPAFNTAIALRVLRFGIILLAATLGLLGILIAAMVIFTHLVSLRSFGVPYMSPLAPLNLSALKDILLRPPLWARDKRPSIFRPQDDRRQEPGLKPRPGS